MLDVSLLSLSLGPSDAAVVVGCFEDDSSGDGVGVGAGSGDGDCDDDCGGANDSSAATTFVLFAVATVAAVAVVDTDDSRVDVGLLSVVSISLIPVATCNVSKWRITLLN